MDGWTFARYTLVMAGVTYLIRALPLALLRGRIRNRLILSGLYYAPYAVLGAMTFPDILYSTGSIFTAGVGLAVALAAAWRNLPMALVAVLAAASAIAMQLILIGLP